MKQAVIREQVIERNIWIDRPRERVWAAVTDPGQIMHWFAPDTAAVPVRQDENGKLTVYAGDMAIDIAVIEVCEPPRYFTTRSLPDRVLTTRYWLDEVRGGTQVTARMGGLEALPPEVRQQHLEVDTVGWEQALKNLEAYVCGLPVPFPQGF